MIKDSVIVINPTPLSVEKFTENDKSNFNNIRKNLFKIIDKYQPEDMEEIVEIADTCLGFENDSLKSNYYYHIEKSFYFIIKKDTQFKEYKFNFYTPEDKKYSQKETRYLLNYAQDIITNNEKFRKLDEFSVCIVNVDVIKRDVPICALYNDEVYVLK